MNAVMHTAVGSDAAAAKKLLAVVLAVVAVCDMVKMFLGVNDLVS